MHLRDNESKYCLDTIKYFERMVGYIGHLYSQQYNGLVYSAS